LRPLVQADHQDSFFELLDYPVSASAAANRRFFATEAHDALRDRDPAESWRRARIAAEADGMLTALTHRYNREVAGGKWRGIMAVEPADGQWRSFRQSLPVVPALASIPDVAPATAALTPATAAPLLRPDQFLPARGWRRIDGLGRSGALLGAGTPSAPARAAITLPAGNWQAVIDLLPLYSADNDGTLRLTVRIDGKTEVLELPRRTGDRDWAMAVLDNRIARPLSGTLGAGRHEITLEAGDTAVMIEAIRFIPADKSITPT